MNIYLENLGSNFVQNKHKQNKAKTKLIEPKPLKTSSIEPIRSDSVL